MGENNLIAAIYLLCESSSSSSEESGNNSSSDENDNLEDELYQEDVAFPVLQLLLHGRRRQHVENFLHTVHTKSDEEFRQDFRLNRETVYTLIGKYC